MHKRNRLSSGGGAPAATKCRFQDTQQTGREPGAIISTLSSQAALKDLKTSNRHFPQTGWIFPCKRCCRPTSGEVELSDGALIPCCARCKIHVQPGLGTSNSGSSEGGSLISQPSHHKNNNNHENMSAAANTSVPLKLDLEAPALTSRPSLASKLRECRCCLQPTTAWVVTTNMEKTSCCYSCQAKLHQMAQTRHTRGVWSSAPMPSAAELQALGHLAHNLIDPELLVILELNESPDIMMSPASVCTPLAIPH